MNDVCFMVQMFEASMNGHMSLSDEEKEVYNQEFTDQYNAIRTALFEAIDETNGVGIAAKYDYYQLFESADDTRVNASMRWSDLEKTAVYLDRLERLMDLSVDVFKL